jgi:hypothetical protein
MKKKLLITLGCSHTEGLGCWDMSINYPPLFNSIHRDFGNLMHINKSHFHGNGWPNKLGKKLGFDKVINLGLAGSSQSSQMKNFVLKYGDMNHFEDYDVLVVWLLTDSIRSSFYKDAVDETLIPNSFNSSLKQELFDSIYKFVSNNGERNFSDIEKDYIREEYVNRRVVKSISKLKKWNFISFHSKTHEYGELIKEIYGDDKTHSFTDIGFSHENDENLISKFCGHFNEDGYEMISDNMFNWIKTTHPHLISNNAKDEIEWEWDGNNDFNERAL